MPRTSERGGPRTRARIAEVASGLFLERGFDAVTVAEIARAAGVSSVTVFNHFPRKEDLYLDRSEDAVAVLRGAVRGAGGSAGSSVGSGAGSGVGAWAGGDVLGSLRTALLDLTDARHPLSGLDEKSVPFFRTVAGSPALVGRAREIAASLEAVLAEELGPGGTLLAAFVIAGYATVLVETARRRLDGEPVEALVDDHRARVERLFVALREGVRA